MSRASSGEEQKRLGNDESSTSAPSPLTRLDRVHARDCVADVELARNSVDTMQVLEALQVDWLVLEVPSAGAEIGSDPARARQTNDTAAYNPTELQRHSNLCTGSLPVLSGGSLGGGGRGSLLRDGSGGGSLSSGDLLNTTGLRDGLSSSRRSGLLLGLDN